MQRLHQPLPPDSEPLPRRQAFVSGNQCQKGAGGAATGKELPNLYAFKRSKITGLTPRPGKRGRLGLPLALGMYELAPLWHGLFTSLGFEVILSGPLHPPHL